ncbi:unnamed protein product, partial [Rangifer tarandus platyrhynchus]|uniref:Uncharacterized protein n=3 Tax=Rangifer tarandus platyrhynchus TaxID=3082113 RepID=A0AC60A3M7_RANTA
MATEPLEVQPPRFIGGRANGYLAAVPPAILCEGPESGRGRGRDRDRNPRQRPRNRQTQACEETGGWRETAGQTEVQKDRLGAGNRGPTEWQRGATWGGMAQNRALSRTLTLFFRSSNLLFPNSLSRKLVQRQRALDCRMQGFQGSELWGPSMVGWGRMGIRSLALPQARGGGERRLGRRKKNRGMIRREEEGWRVRKRSGGRRVKGGRREGGRWGGRLLAAAAAG